MEVVLANPRGFCAGVIRAIEIVERALEVHGPPIYVLHEIVHNGHVVAELRRKGAVFVEGPDEVPPSSIAIFSAHGVGSRVVEEARARGLRIIDATCPLVTKVHLQARRYSRKGMELVIVGHAGHPEVEGHRGQVDGAVHVLCSVEEVEALRIRDPRRVAYVTQTTLSMDDTRGVIEALERRFPSIRGPELEDICYATQNRQNAVRTLTDTVDLLLVVGAHNSSNSNRLREVGELSAVDSHLIEGADDIDPSWLAATPRVGVTAGASTPELLVREVIERLVELGARSVVEVDGSPEGTVFSLPDVIQLEGAPS